MNNFIPFTNKYPLSKTLRFSLIPTKDTKKSIQKDNILENDRRLADSYSKVKKTIDEYHKKFIDTALDGQYIDITRYAALYFNKTRTEAEEKEINDLRVSLRKEIVEMFSKPEVKETYTNLFNKKLLQKDIPNWLEKCTEQDRSRELYWDSEFEKFTTYFTGFHKNRKNIYCAEEKSTAIAYRLIDENLPRYLDNSHLFENAYRVLKEEINHVFEVLCKESGRAYSESDFVPKMFKNTLTQSGIDAYNFMLQGKSPQSGKRIQGLNECINLYNQRNPQNRLARLKPLYKQILSDRNQLSFIPDRFHSDIELLDAIGKFCTEFIAADNLIQRITRVISSLNQYNTKTLYINNKNYKALNDMSVKLFGQYSVIADAMEHYYVTFKHPLYEERLASAKSESAREKLIKEKEAYMKRPAVTIAEVQLALEEYIKELDNSDINKGILQGYSASCIADYFANYCIADRQQTDSKKYTMEANIAAKYNCVKGIINISHEEEYTLRDKNKADLKAFLDALMEFYHFVQPLYIADGKNADNKNEHFYGIFDPMYEAFSSIR